MTLLEYNLCFSILAEEFHTNKGEHMRKARELDEKEACQISWDDYTLVSH